MPENTPHPMDREVRDRALGRYMDTFSRMEGMLRLCIQTLLGLDSFRAYPLFATLMTKQTVELFTAAGKMMLRAEDAERVSKLADRIGRRNMRRNHIVHGHWTIFVEPDGPGNFRAREWIRVYPNADPALAGLQLDDPKLMGFYNFTIPALDKATDHVEEMVQALTALAVELPSLIARLQTPEERFRTWVQGRLESSGGVSLRLSQYRYP